MLGCFHTFTSLLGAIGTLTEGTWIRSIMEVVYGGNAVQHMMTGKSVQRAFRGHLLIDRSLNYLVVSDLLQVDSQFKTLLDQAEEIYSSLMAKKVTMESVVALDVLTSIKDTIDTKKAELHIQSETSCLWMEA